MAFLCGKSRGEENLLPYLYPSDSVFRSAFTYNTEKEFSNSYTFTAQSIDVDDERDKLEKQNKLEALTIAEFMFIGLSFLLVLCTMPFSLLVSLKFVNSFERVVVMRLGKARSIRGPGTVFILPCIDKATTVDIRVNSNVLPAVNIVTRDRGLVEFTAAVFSKVVDPLSSICAVQNREQALHNLAYATLYKKLSRRTLTDITSPISLNVILASVQEELNKFSQPLGIEITEVTVTQIRVLKQNENQAISLFNSLVKSELGTKIMGTLETHLKDALISGQGNGINETFSIIPKENQPVAVREQQHYPCRDLDIDNLLQQLRCCCNESLVSRIGKRFIVRCEDATGGPAELLLDLKNGSGSFEWLINAAIVAADVEITLRKETLFALINGSLSPLSAYINGSVVIKGSVSDVTSLKLLAARAKEFKIAQ